VVSIWFPRSAARRGDEHGWREVEIREAMSLGQWTSSGLVFAVAGGLWSLPISPATGRITAAATQLMLGAGVYRRPTVSRDGQVVFADSVAQRVIERVQLTPDASEQTPVALHADGNGVPARASVTRDGAMIVFERRSGRRDEIWQKNLRTGAAQVVLSLESDGVVNATISPDGARVGYTVPANDRQSVTVNGHVYVAETSGGVPKPVCDNCGIYEFLSDSTQAVMTAGDSAIRIIDITTLATRDVVKSDARIERPSVSPDDRLLAFRRTQGTVAKVFVGRLPAAGDAPLAAEAASQVDEPTTTGRPAGWSADSRVLYLLLDTDGYRCLWGQRVDDRGHLAGKPFPARHFHDRRGSTISTSLGNAIAADGFVYETGTFSGNLWRLVMAGNEGTSR
jgi:dipeptidyl aminopeptidase/acylaminoacyl peptidase